MSPSALQTRIEGLAPGTVARVTDLTGTQDHYEVSVVSSAFAGKGTLERHRMVFAMVEAEMATGEVHALALQTLTPEQAQGG